MTSNGFSILLILLEGLKRDIAPTWEGIDGTTDGIWKQRMNWYDNKGSEILNEPPYELKTNEVKGWITGKNLRTNEDTWGNLDTWERGDHEPNRDHLNEAPVRLKDESWKLEWIILRWWAPENQTEKTPELLRMGEKNSHNRKQLWEDGIKLEPWIFDRTDKKLRGTLLQSSKPENDDENHNELLRYSGRIKRGKVDPKMKRIWKRPWRRHVTDENSFLRQTWKWIWEWLQEN